MSKNQFRGVIGGVTYTDRAAFEKAARDAGHRLGNNRTGDWRVGLPVRIRFEDGTVVAGQVWAKGPEPRCGYVWVALDNGRYAQVFTSDGRVNEVGGTSRIGKVAA
jgi:hypothetical protein